MTEERSPKYIGETEKNLARLREGELDEWITTSQAAQISDYHPEHIRELVREGRINAKKFATVWQVDTASLLNYMASMEEKGQKRGPKSVT